MSTALLDHAARERAGALGSEGRAGALGSGSAIERLEAELLDRPQVHVPVTHHFAPGVYVREVFMPAGTFIIGHEHKTEHLNIVISGRASVMMDGAMQELTGPCTFVSQPGVRKVLYIHEDMRYQTVHPTHTTDLDLLAEELIVKSAPYTQHLEDMEQLKLLILSAGGSQ